MESKVKVLYVAHFHEGSGYSVAAENYVKALVSCDVDVVCRNIKLSATECPPSELILQLEQKEISNITHVIQHVLPHHMSYVDGCKNIGIFIYDISNPSFSGWDRYVSCMDEIWIPNEINVKLFKGYSNVKIVPHTCDVSQYIRDYDVLDIPELGGTCMFYTIADLSKRKNIIDTVIAFHSEFHANEPVNLLIKTSKYGLSPEECAEAVRNDLNSIKTELKLYPSIDCYKPEILITHRISNEQIGSIHRTGHCYVNSSRGEAWNQPQFDAWAYGNKVVYYTSRYEPTYSYLDECDCDKCCDVDYPCHPVMCDFEPCFGYTDTFDEIGTGREKWLSSNIFGLRHGMRNVYNKWLSDQNKYEHNHYKKYSYESVGSKMKGLLIE